VLSAVGRESYGVVSGFLNLVRNAGNVTSVAVATAIVTATMGSLGYEPSLDAVRDGTDIGVKQAFTVGLKYAYLAMAGSLLLAMTISAFKVGRPGPPSDRAGIQ
jgi:Na+/melibiose symporter-like transporter